MTSVVIDTNVIVRLFVKDIPSQLLTAQKFIQSIEENKIRGLVSILVINEIIWILEKHYGVQREEYIPALVKLISFKNIKIIEVKKDLLFNVLETMQKSKIDFTDIYLASVAKAKKQEVVSFDKDFEKIS